MTDATEPDESMNELVDALRAEILGEADDVAATDVPDDLISLVGLADVSRDVALALDDLLVEDDTISGALHDRLVDRARQEINRRASVPIYLEQVLHYERARLSLTAVDLASRIGTTPAAVESIETADYGIHGLPEETIAAWIDELQIDLDIASEASRSVPSPAGGVVPRN